MCHKQIGITNMPSPEKEEQSARVVDTCCLGCVFATNFSTKEGEFKQTHDGCAMRALTKFRHQNNEVLDCEDEKGNEFHVIKGRVCPFHRRKEWVQPNENLGDATVRVRTEAKFTYDAIIYFNPDMQMEAKDIMATIDSLSRCNLKPKRVIIVNDSDIRPSQLVKTVKESPLPWRIETVMEKDCAATRAIDIGSKKSESMFMTCFVAGRRPHAQYFDDIDIKLYDELDKFVMVLPEDWTYIKNSENFSLNRTYMQVAAMLNGLTVLRVFYRQVAGNEREFIVTKTQNICESQECPTLIRTSKEMIPQE